MEQIEDLVLFERKGNLGIVSLNRPKKLNSLTRELTAKLREILRKCEIDENVSMIFLRGNGGRAFSAGGDMVAAGNALRKEGIEEAVKAMKREYGSGEMIAEYSKPIISYMDGITMGGGAGLAMVSDFKIVTEKTLWAMPEPKIGFFPDVGMSYFFARMRSFLGVYLSVTGRSITGEDCRFAGIADVKVETKDYENLLEEFVELSKEKLENTEWLHRVKEISAKYEERKEKGYLEKNINEIEVFFAEPSMVAIWKGLLQEKESLFVRECLEEMARNSPLSMSIIFEQVKEAKGRSLEKCYAMDAIMAKHFLEGKELLEGVQAIIVEKTQNAKWEYSCLEEVPEEVVLSYFEE